MKRLWRGRFQRVAHSLGLVTAGIVLSFGMTGRVCAGESQLSLDFVVFCSDSSDLVPFLGCRSARSFEVYFRNPHEIEVFEGSEVLSESLSIEVYSANGDRIAWWQPEVEDNAGSGVLRRWAPGEEAWIGVPWYFQTGALVGSYFGTEEEFERPIAPFDGYRVVFKWQDLSGEVLEEYSEWFDHEPALIPDLHCYSGNLGELIFDSQFLTAGASHTVFVPLFAWIGRSDVHERLVSVDPEQREIVADVTVTGPGSPFWGPVCKYFPLRLPALERGHYTLRFINADTGRDSWDIHIPDAIEFDDEPSMERPTTH